MRPRILTTLLALLILGCGPDDPNTYFMPECHHDLAALENSGWAWHVRQALATGEAIHLNFSDPKPSLPHDVVALIDNNGALTGVACRAAGTSAADFLASHLQKGLRPLLVPTYVTQRSSTRRDTASADIRTLFALLEAYGHDPQPLEVRLTLPSPGARTDRNPAVHLYTRDDAIHALGPLLDLYRGLDD